MTSRRRQLQVVYVDEAQRATDALLKDSKADIGEHLNRLDGLGRLLEHQPADWTAVWRPLAARGRRGSS